MDEALRTLPEAPAWAIYVGLAGRVFVFAAIVFFALSIVGWIRSNGSPKMERLGKVGFTLGAASLFLTFGSLAVLFLAEQFEFDYVYRHSEHGLELKYKIAAIWSGQQGSFLLWAVTSSIFGLLAVRKTGLYRRWFTIAYAGFLASLAGILCYETPFNLIKEVFMDGKQLMPLSGTGLTPALQNYWVVIHPPTIFMGFGSLTVLFCWSISAMLNRNPIDWVRMIRPWAITSTAILGLGLMMGGFWAYETLGWGGFWAWDPVENVSFVPWVLGVAFIHGLIIQSTRGSYVGGNLLLGGLPFILFVYGTFLTRSGFLGDSSVHSFAEMQRGALWVLMGLGSIALVAFFSIYFKIGRRLSLELGKNIERDSASRESLYRTGIILLSGLALATAFGMSMPFFSSLATKRNVAVDEWLYHQVLSWAYIPIMVLLALGPFASWRNLGWKVLLNKLVNILSVSVGLTGFALLYLRHPEWGLKADQSKTTLILFTDKIPTVYWVSFLILLSLFAMTANIWRIIESLRRSPMSIGGFLAHIGIAVFMAGMVLSRGLEQEAKIQVTRSRPDTNNGFTVTLPRSQDPSKLFDRSNKLEFEVKGPDGAFVARPGLYYTDSPDGPAPTMWPHIQRFWTHDVYFSLFKPAMTFWDKPVFFKPGETQKLMGVTVTYRGYKMVGTPGAQGTKFVADVTVAYEGQNFDVKPTFAIGEDPDFPLAGELRVLLARIDANTKGAELQLYRREPLYPVIIYYKPMTCLVWAGAGILVLGGLMAAFYRRNRPTTESESLHIKAEDLEPIQEDAPAPTP